MQPGRTRAETRKNPNEERRLETPLAQITLVGKIVGRNQDDLGYAIVRPRALQKTPGKS